MRAKTLLARHAAAVADRQDDAPFPVVELPDKPFVHRKHGKRVHQSTAIRWALYGIRGGTIKLRSWMIGGTRVTDRAAYEEFVQACSGTVPTPHTDRRRQADTDAAAAELDLIGIK